LNLIWKDRLFSLVSVLSIPGKKGRGKARIRGLNFFKINNHGVDSWRIVTPTINGRRTVKTFRDEHEAKAYYDYQFNQLRAGGVTELLLSESQRLDAKAALAILSGYGVSLEAAAQYYAKTHEASETQTVSEAIGQLLRAKKADKLSEVYLTDLAYRLGRFAETFGDRPLAGIGRGEIAQWLRNLDVIPLTRNIFYLRLSVLFSFAIEQGWVDLSPMQRSMRAKVIRADEPGILSPAQFAGLLSNASPETLPYWLIGGFCGLRTAELKRLEWHDVDFEAGLIEVKRSKSKTASRRHIPIRPALEAWLAPYRGLEGRICPVGLRARLEADRRRAGITNWPSNALRHSFASYHLAHFADASRLALEMGHKDSTLVFEHYRQLVKPAVAKSWWSILPADKANNVVSISA
jgi:integrase